jgi:predicted hydrolase (HD superfamily)
MINRRQAIDILHEFVRSPSLRRHALQVEACVVAYAEKYGAESRRGR